MKKIIYLTMATVFMAACNKENSGGSYPVNVPSTYTFDNVNYAGQTTRIDMLVEMANYMKTANTSGVTISSATLKNMFSNSSSPFANPDLNTSGKQLKDKCYLGDQSFFELYMDSIALASQSTVAGTNGTAGVVVSTSSPTKKYLFGANGIEYMQIIEKGLSGAVFYYQATDYYLSTAGIGAGIDNTVIVPGEGTAMQHHWDEAFGYFTAPIDFPQNTTDLIYWAKYSNTVDPQIACNEDMMFHFKRGRMAINNNNHTQKEVSAYTIKTTWDKIIAATIIHYFNESLSNFGDNALRNHDLSEALAFLICLKYNPDRAITNADLNTVMGYLGANFYTVSSINVNHAKDLLSTVYGLDAVKNDL